MTSLPRVTIWNEFRHEKEHAEVAKVYPDGIHEALPGRCEPKDWLCARPRSTSRSTA